MRRTITLAAMVLFAGLAVSGCHDGRPGHASDHHHEQNDHDHDH